MPITYVSVPLVVHKIAVNLEIHKVTVNLEIHKVTVQKSKSANIMHTYISLVNFICILLKHLPEKEREHIMKSMFYVAYLNSVPFL